MNPARSHAPPTSTAAKRRYPTRPVMGRLRTRVGSEAVGPGQNQDEVDEDERGRAAAEHEVGHGRQLGTSSRTRDQGPRSPQGRGRGTGGRSSVAPPEGIRAEMGVGAVSAPCGIGSGRARNAQGSRGGAGGGPPSPSAPAGPPVSLSSDGRDRPDPWKPCELCGRLGRTLREGCHLADAETGLRHDAAARAGRGCPSGRMPEPHHWPGPPPGRPRPTRPGHPPLRRRRPAEGLTRARDPRGSAR